MTFCSNKTVTELHIEYHQWISELTFYKEELNIFETLLLQNALNKRQWLNEAKIGYFQNCFENQKKVIDRLITNLYKAEIKLTSFVHSVSGMGLNSIKMDNHATLREEKYLLEKKFFELKQNFRSFEE